MEIETWWIWMAIAALFVIAEIFTAGFFMLWFGIGAAAAGILAMFEIGMVWQLGSFGGIGQLFKEKAASDQGGDPIG